MCMQNDKIDPKMRKTDPHLEKDNCSVLVCKIDNITGCPIKKVSIKNFYSELLKASIYSF